jgi:hypothetical protein
MKSYKFVPFPRLAVLGLSALIVMGLAVHADAITSFGVGRIRGFEGVQVIGLPDFACTSSFDFEDMPGMSLTFTLDTEGPVVVLFQGQFGGFSSTPNAQTAIRFTIDRKIVGSAIAVRNDHHGRDSQTFGFNAFSSPLAPGGHTVNVLWNTGTGPDGETSCVEERSLIILRP